MRPSPTLLFFAAAFALFGCSKTEAQKESMATAPSTAPVVTPAAATDAGTVAAPAQDAGTPSEATLAWRATQGPGTTVKVSLVVGRETVSLRTLDATSDDAGLSGTPATCELRTSGSSKTASSFGCGGTPAYNYFTAALKDGNLVITHVAGVEGGGEPEKKTIVKTMPLAATALKVKPFKKPKKAAPVKTCPKGEVLNEGACHKECTTDADCGPSGYCQQYHSITPDGRIGPVTGQGCEE